MKFQAFIFDMDGTIIDNMRFHNQTWVKLQIFLTAAQKLGVAPEQRLVFEDSRVGIEAAQQAGMQIVALATTLPAQELAGHKHILRIVPDYTTLNPANLISNSSIEPTPHF